MVDSIKLNAKVSSELSTIFRGVNQETNRRNLKIRLNQLYETASEDDGKMIDMFINLLNKLPNSAKHEAIGELELTTSFLDPIFTALFHDPENNRHFAWTNKKEENTGSLRPDGIISSIKNGVNITLGYCEVKTEEAAKSGSAYIDLVKLATFSRDLPLRKESKKSMCIQAIGYKVCIYFLEEIYPDITIMSEVFSFNVPRSISEIENLISQLDVLKRIVYVINTECQSSYMYPAIQSEDTEVAYNPKRRKTNTATFP